MILSSLNNWLRSRTRVAIVMFQNAQGFEDSLPFSYTCRNFHVPECAELEELDPFSCSVAIFKFQNVLNVKNRFRCRTRVATIMY